MPNSERWFHSRILSERVREHPPENLELCITLGIEGQAVPAMNAEDGGRVFKRWVRDSSAMFGDLQVSHETVPNHITDDGGYLLQISIHGPAERFSAEILEAIRRMATHRISICRSAYAQSLMAA